jgi:hypothetical protein
VRLIKERGVCATARTLIASIAALAVACVQCQAADIQFNSKEGLVWITGTLVPDDINKFKSVIAKSPREEQWTVILESNGGHAPTGILICMVIRRHDLTTYVPSNANCASACALIWLAGVPRVVGNNAHIGFHAAYLADKTVASWGNAAVGAYLTRLGFDWPAIQYFTQTSPQSIEWLTSAKAKEINLDFRFSNTPPAKKLDFFADAPMSEEFCQINKLNPRCTEDY